MILQFTTRNTTNTENNNNGCNSEVTAIQRHGMNDIHVHVHVYSHKH